MQKVFYWIIFCIFVHEAISNPLHHVRVLRKIREVGDLIASAQTNYANEAPRPYSYQYDTGTHQASEESDGRTVRGFFSFTAEDGKQYRIDYTADDSGFHPTGNHIASH